ncbi:uncharacterized protein BDV17DRAFT_288028 [Aspergillus undulatus]|uniref:uncharacterized protein n=1 Tax=Aspergillus undulatus TaxID=1810928 RepID=UPI003CCE2D84
MTAQLSNYPESEVGLVFATPRQEHTPQLADLSAKTSGRVVSIQTDSGDMQSLRGVVETVERILKEKGKGGLDILVNNAGISPFTMGKIENMDGNELNHVFHTNVTTTHLVTRAFLPLLRNGDRKKPILNSSSTVGSISLAPTFHMSPAYSYKVSKAGMNSSRCNTRFSMKRKDLRFLLGYAPRWTGRVRTFLLRTNGAKEELGYVKDGGRELNGRFLNIRAAGWEDAEGPNRYDGVDPPW